MERLKMQTALVFMFTLLSIVPLAMAAVTVANQTGTISITTPAGEVITVEKGQPLPPIPPGSTIEVITGTAEIAATGSDTVNVIVNNTTATLTNGATVQVKVDLQSGDASLSVLTGSVTLLNPDGTSQVVAPGESVTAPASAPVTAQSLDVPGDPVSDPGGSSVTGY